MSMRIFLPYSGRPAEQSVPSSYWMGSLIEEIPSLKNTIPKSQKYNPLLDQAEKDLEVLKGTELYSLPPKKKAQEISRRVLELREVAWMEGLLNEIPPLLKRISERKEYTQLAEQTEKDHDYLKKVSQGPDLLPNKAKSEEIKKRMEKLRDVVEDINRTTLRMNP